MVAFRIELFASEAAISFTCGLGELRRICPPITLKGLTSTRGLKALLAKLDCPRGTVIWYASGEILPSSDLRKFMNTPVSLCAGILVIRQSGVDFAAAAAAAVPFLDVKVAVHESPVEIVLPSADAEALPPPEASIATSLEAKVSSG